MKPTRCTENSFTLIDNIFTNNLSEWESGILQIDLTDHFPIFYIIKNYFSFIDTRTKIEYRTMSDPNLDKMCRNLKNYQYCQFVNPFDCNESLNRLDDILLKEFNECCPIKSRYIKPREKKKPWINHEIRLLIKRRENFYNLLSQNKMTRHEYNRFRNFVTKQIREAKKKYYDDLLENIRGDIKKTWGVINSVIKPDHSSKSKGIDDLICNGNVIKNPQAIAHCLNDHFASVGENISRTFGSQPRVNVDTNVSQTRSMFLRNTTPLEVNRIICSLKNKKGHVSTYPAKVLKYASEIISPILSDIINLSFSSGTFPDRLKIARVVPIHKGGNKSELNNYRPISVLPLLSKVFEKIVHCRLSNFLEKLNVLTNSQYGFRKGMSTIQAVMSNLQYVYEGLDEGSTVISLFLDFSKAFDCIDHKILLRKLERYGIRGIVLQWFKSYLSDRKQFVSINSSTSSISSLNYGVPQGSILGPLLFIIFINDFPQSSNFFKFTLYADDSTLTCKFKHNNPDLIKNCLNNELINVHFWLVQNRIKINYDKTKFIIFNYRKSINISSLDFSGHQIERTDSIKFLGMIIDEKLSFKKHINLISSKTSKTIGLFYRLNKIFPLNILKTLYHCLIVPYISYGIEIWYGAPQTESTRIFVLQKKVIRAMNSLPYNFHTNIYFKLLNLPKLDDIYKLYIGKYVFLNLEKFPVNSHYHSYHTRNSDNLVTPSYNLSRTQSSWKFCAVSLWNSIPDFIKESRSEKAFKFKFKRHLLSMY